MKKKNNASEEAKQDTTEKDAENKQFASEMEENGKNEDELMSSGEEIVSEDEGSSINETTDKVIGALKAAEAKVAEIQDKYVRLSAEFDNYRKRTLREKMDLVKYADENLLTKILPFMDDFDRALSHMDITTDCVAMKSGIDLIYSKFSEFLKQNGVKEIESLNNEFNVDLHEAVAKVPVTDDKKGKVVDVVQKGYYLQDKVIRFSKVIVGE